MARRVRSLMSFALALCIAASIVLWHSPGIAVGQAPDGHSFEGSCAIVGRAILADSMGLVPRRSSFEFRGEGFCAGTLDGRELPEEGAPARLVSSGPRPLHSCELGYDPGISFQLTFYPGLDAEASIFGDGDILDVARLQMSVFRGQQGGVGLAVNTLQGHLETIRRCVKGTVRSGTVGLQIDTITPLKSSDPEASARRTGRGKRAGRDGARPQRITDGHSARARPGLSGLGTPLTA
jgi:hypothetical protein